jgi:cyclopropane fatty-acyl-phospholipid synthase-like methyltransferase
MAFRKALMEGIEYIYELCEALPRSGPGDNASTRHAFNAIPKFQTTPFILDIGCGQGMQTIELAKISNGKIVALDNHQTFLELLMQQAQEHGVAGNIVPLTISMLDMEFEKEAFDLIWSEGALYIMGFQNGLKRCYQLLRSEGYLALTELVYMVPDPPDELVEYFSVEYPDIKNIGENIKTIKEEGFRLVSNFTLPETSWLDNYYGPMEKELTRLGKKYKENAVASTVFKAFRNEIDFYRKYSKCYGYAFFVMQKNS